MAALTVAAQYSIARLRVTGDGRLCVANGERVPILQVVAGSAEDSLCLFFARRKIAGYSCLVRAGIRLIWIWHSGS